MKLDDKLLNLQNYLKKLNKVVIAYSGGVDSNLLLKVAKDTLGDNVVAITIHSIMHSEREIKESIEYAKSFDVNHIVIKLDEFNIKEFIDNDEKRCYFCKKEVFSIIKQVAKENNIDYVLDGTNIDDLSDYRPGLKALQELDIISPLKECNLTKQDIRDISKDLNLNTHNKAAFACLATRIPYNTKITKEKLTMIDKGEDYLFSLGFRQFRVRIHDDLARIEVCKSEIHKFFKEELLQDTYKKFKEIGFEYVTLDMNGYQMGSMNKGVN